MANKEQVSVLEKKKELQKLKLAVKSGTEQDVSKIKKLKKDIARLLTKQNNN